MYNARYRCRLCGEEFISEATGNRELAEKCMLYISTKNKNFLNENTIIHPDELEIHFCKNNSLGVADFLGFEYTE